MRICWGSGGVLEGGVNEPAEEAHLGLGRTGGDLVQEDEGGARGCHFFLALGGGGG